MKQWHGKLVFTMIVIATSLLVLFSKKTYDNSHKDVQNLNDQIQQVEKKTDTSAVDSFFKNLPKGLPGKG